MNKEVKLFISLLKDLGIFSFVNENNQLFYTVQEKKDSLMIVKNKSKELSINNEITTKENYHSVNMNKIDNTTNTISGSVVTNKTDNAFEVLKEMKTLDEVKDYLSNFKDLSLAKTAINTVFGVGNSEADLLMIGEAPGADEDQQGEPFVGKSGQLLTKALYSVGIHREKIFITNSVFWRPPGNRNPTSMEVSICKPFLQKIISLIKPKMILIVGKVAANTLLEEDIPLSKMRGKWILKDWGYSNETVRNIQVRVIYHPAYLLRNPKQKKVFWFDLLEIFNKILELKLTV